MISIVPSLPAKQLTLVELLNDIILSGCVTAKSKVSIFPEFKGYSTMILFIPAVKELITSELLLTTG